MKMIEAFVYEWTDSSNGKKYLGVHKGVPDDGYIGSGKYFKRAYNKRPECFTREIISTGTTDEMIELESFILEVIDARNNHNYYNMRTNEMPYRVGAAHSAETKLKMSASNKGKIVSAETRAKMSAANKGKIISAEQRAKSSATQKGRTLSEEHKLKLRAASSNKGKPRGEAVKLKISAAL